MTTTVPKQLATLRTARLLILVAFIGSAGIVHGATRTWDGSYSTYWSASQNWVEGVAPVDGDDLVFPAGAARLVNTNNAWVAQINSILFTGSGYVLNGSALALSDGIDTTGAGSVNTINNDLELGASQVVDSSSGTATLYVNGDVDLGTYTLTMYGLGVVRIGGAVSGSGGITKAGFSSTHWLEGSSGNTYTGPTIVEHGTLMLAKTSGNAVGGDSLTVGNDISSADTAIVRLAETIRLPLSPLISKATVGWMWMTTSTRWGPLPSIADMPARREPAR